MSSNCKVCNTLKVTNTYQINCNDKLKSKTYNKLLEA